MNSLFLVNDPQALYVSPGCFKCISGINLSPANKAHLLLHSFYTVKTKYLLWVNHLESLLLFLSICLLTH